MVEISACRLFNDKPSPQPTITNYELHLQNIIWSNLNKNVKILLIENAFLKSPQKCAQTQDAILKCVVKLTSIGSDNGLSPGRRQAIIWTNTGILLIGPLETNFIEILIGIQTLSFKKMHLKMSSAKWRPFCLGLNGLISSSAGVY